MHVATRQNVMHRATQNGAMVSIPRRNVCRRIDDIKLLSLKAPTCRRGATKPVISASMDSGPAYNKYKSRQEIERDYFREWERATVISREELDRPMTITTFLKFLPKWFRFYGLPGPLRFLIHIAATTMASKWHGVHRKLVLEGAKLDMYLIKRSKLPESALPIRLILARYHYRISPLENLRYRWALFTGKIYDPVVQPLASEDEPYPEKEKIDYDPAEAQWPSATSVISM